MSQSDEYSKIDDYCVRFTELYENVKKETFFFAVCERFINDFKLHTQHNARQALQQSRVFDIEFDLSALQVIVIEHKVINVAALKQRNSKRNSVTKISASNINTVAARENIDYIKENFIKNQEREDRTISTESKKCYNCDFKKHLFNKCKNSHVLDFVFEN